MSVASLYLRHRSSSLHRPPACYDVRYWEQKQWVYLHSLRLHISLLLGQPSSDCTPQKLHLVFGSILAQMTEVGSIVSLLQRYTMGTHLLYSGLLDDSVRLMLYLMESKALFLFNSMVISS